MSLSTRSPILSSCFGWLTVRTQIENLSFLISSTDKPVAEDITPASIF
ncbi:MAG: hypothetical protein ACRYE9_05995 [Janthinobacterium lividum]